MKRQKAKMKNTTKRNAALLRRARACPRAGAEEAYRTYRTYRTALYPRCAARNLNHERANFLSLPIHKSGDYPFMRRQRASARSRARLEPGKSIVRDGR